jgi:hypothetical protein
MFTAPEEYFYLDLLSEWERAAPADRHHGTAGNGEARQNTQTVRMAYLLRIIDNADGETFRKLEARTGRQDGRSYVSKDRSWMREPYELSRGWYLEGCMSLQDKQRILQDLPVIGAASLSFVSCSQDFVAGKSLEKYRPQCDEAYRRKLEDWIKAAERKPL